MKPKVFPTVLIVLFVFLVQYISCKDVGINIQVEASKNRRTLEGQKGSFLFGLTFNLKNNDSVVQINPENGDYLMKYETESYLTVSNIAYNPLKRQAYLISVSGDMVSLRKYHVDTLQLVNITQLQSQAPIDYQFDSLLNKLFSVTFGSAPKFGFTIVALNPDTGETSDIVDFSDVHAVSEYCNTYNELDSKYYVSIVSHNFSALNQIYEFDMKSKSLSNAYVLPTTISNLAYDSKHHRLVGITSSSTFSILDLKTGKMESKIDLQKYGFRELGYGSIDQINNLYYTLFETHEAVVTLLQIDLSTFNVRALPFYDHMTVHYFIPDEK